jgi:hypothetical protein
MKAINQWCRAKHRPLDEQYRELLAKLHGHYGYYNRIGNWKALAAFRSRPIQLWQYWLNRRSQRARLRWNRFKRIWALFRFPHARRLEAPASANP